jgi:RNA polymerase sigma factor (sigma-70 family)
LGISDPAVGTSWLSSHPDCDAEPGDGQTGETGKGEHRRFRQADRGELHAGGVARPGGGERLECVREAQEQVGYGGENTGERQRAHKRQPAFGGTKRERDPQNQGHRAHNQSKSRSYAGLIERFHHCLLASNRLSSRQEYERERAESVTDVTSGAETRFSSVDRESELELVRRVRDGDTAAFDTVHATFNIRLFGFLARLARSKDVAQDLLEETWLRFVRHAGRLDADTRLGPWLFAVARNVHVSYCRSRAMEESRTVDVGLWPSGLLDSPFEQTAGNELERRIEAALATLPAAFREVLLLVGVEGLRPAEAAVVCGISPDALRQRLSRARALLAQRLEESASRAAPASARYAHDDE